MNLPEHLRRIQPVSHSSLHIPHADLRGILVPAHFRFSPVIGRFLSEQEKIIPEVKTPAAFSHTESRGFVKGEYISVKFHRQPLISHRDSPSVS